MNYRSPVMTVNPTRALDQVKAFQKHLPNVGIYYAYKCFSDAEIVKAIDGSIAGYDVASEQECRELIKLGVDPSRLLFANPVKIPSQISYANNAGVMGYAFQSKNELDKLAALAPGADVMCRVLVPDEKNTDGQKFSQKFGAQPELVVGLLEYAVSLGLRPFALTFHVGSQSTLPSLWSEAIAICGQLTAQAAQRGIKLTTLNIGGGFPVDYQGDGSVSFPAIASAIRTAIREHIPADIQIIAEPGRFIVAGSASIITSVIGHESREGNNWLYLDTGVFSALLETFEFHRLLQQITPLKKGTETPSKTFILAGPTCDGDDMLPNPVMLPAGTSTGDKLVITNAGAYTLAYATRFNGFDAPRVQYVYDTVSTKRQLAESAVK